MLVLGKYRRFDRLLCSKKYGKYARIKIRSRARGKRLGLGVILAEALCSLPAQDLREFEKRVTEFTLANGLRFIIVERHDAPVLSLHTYVKAGSVDDPFGQTGISHMLERMAFTGTETVGTRDWPAEKKTLDALD